MARRPNFDYEKRQRELAKKKKKAEKQERRQANKGTGSDTPESDNRLPDRPDPAND